MIRVFLVGVWCCLVTAAAGYAAIAWPVDGGSAKAKVAAEENKVVDVTVKPLSIPAFRGGKVDGYYIIELSFLIERKLLSTLVINPEAFVMDAALSAIYGDDTLIDKADRKKWLELASTIREGINAKYGRPTVKDVVIRQLGFIPFGEVRGGNTGRSQAAKRPKGSTKADSDGGHAKPSHK